MLSNRPQTPQCFLLTPKLLPDLPYSREVTILQIMNGPHIKDVASGFSMVSIYCYTVSALLMYNEH